MKKIVVLISMALISVIGYSQISQPNPFTNFQSFGSATTWTRINGALYSFNGIVNAEYADTASANLATIRLAPGAQIRVGNKIYYRNSTATGWVEFGSGSGTVTSVGLSMPSAFSVANSPITGAGTLTVTGAGTTSQYIRGDGSLATTPVLTNEWHLTGNSGTTAGTNFIGTTDDVDFVLKRNSIEWLRRSTSNNTIFSNVPFSGAAQDSFWTSDGTGALRRVAQSDANGGKNRVGLYLNNTETFTNKRAIIFGTQLMFVGNSWAGGTGGTGPAWSTLISDFYGKTKRTSFSNGAELNVAWHASRNLTNGNSRDSIWFVDCAYIPFFGMATSINPLFGNDYSDGRSIPKTCNYIREGYRALMANYWMDVDTFSVNSLADANYRSAVAADSIAGKCAVGAFGLGAFSWTKPLGKTGVFIGTFISDGTRKTQGEVVVRLNGTEIFREDLNNQNIANRRGTAVLGQSLAVGYSYKVIALMNLPSAAGTIEVESIGDSTAFDYVGYPVDPTIARKPFYANNFPYGGGFPYFDIPRTSIDSGNVAMQDAIAEFSSYGYPAFIRNNNQDMDSTTHLFDAHPSTIGNQIIARGYTNNITSVGYVPTAQTTGGSSRFGVSGEDATATQNRLFNAAGNTFQIQNNDGTDESRIIIGTDELELIVEQDAVNKETGFNILPDDIIARTDSFFIKRDAGNTSFSMDTEFGEFTLGQFDTDLYIDARYLSHVGFENRISISTSGGGNIVLGDANGQGTLTQFLVSDSSQEMQFGRGQRFELPDDVRFRVGNNDSIAYFQNTRVGIGTSAPTQLLEVAGNIKYTGQVASTKQTVTYGTTTTWDWNAGTNAEVTLTGNITTFTITNAVAGTYATIRMVQDGTGSRLLSALPANSKVFNGGAGAITLSTAANSIDLLTVYYDGTNYYWNYALNYN